MDNRIVFHFNKAHNQDQSIPPWVIKAKGQTYYVHDLCSTVGFSTKNTPGNEHTKGSLMFRGTLRIDNEEGRSIAYIE